MHGGLWPPGTLQKGLNNSPERREQYFAAASCTGVTAD